MQPIQPQAQAQTRPRRSAGRESSGSSVASTSQVKVGEGEADAESSRHARRRSVQGTVVSGRISAFETHAARARPVAVPQHVATSHARSSSRRSSAEIKTTTLITTTRRTVTPTMDHDAKGKAPQQYYPSYGQQQRTFHIPASSVSQARRYSRAGSFSPPTPISDAELLEDIDLDFSFDFTSPASKRVTPPPPAPPARRVPGFAAPTKASVARQRSSDTQRSVSGQSASSASASASVGRRSIERQPPPPPAEPPCSTPPRQRHPRASLIRAEHDPMRRSSSQALELPNVALTMPSPSRQSPRGMATSASWNSRAKKEPPAPLTLFDANDSSPVQRSRKRRDEKQAEREAASANASLEQEQEPQQSVWSPTSNATAESDGPLPLTPLSAGRRARDSGIGGEQKSWITPRTRKRAGTVTSDSSHSSVPPLRSPPPTGPLPPLPHESEASWHEASTSSDGHQNASAFPPEAQYALGSAAEIEEVEMMEGHNELGLTLLADTAASIRRPNAVLSAAERYELAVAGLSPNVRSDRLGSLTDGSPNTVHSSLFSEPMSTTTSRATRTSAASVQERRASLLSAWDKLATGSSSLDMERGKSASQNPSPVIKLTGLPEVDTEDEEHTRQWIEDQRKSAPPSASPSFSGTDGSDGSRPAGPLVLNTRDSDDAGLFVPTSTVRPLLLDNSDKAQDVTHGLGLILEPAVNDTPPRRSQESLKPDDSSSVDGFACNITPPMAQAPTLEPLQHQTGSRESLMNEQRASNFKNLVSNAVLQTPTSPGRISAMFNLLANKGRLDGATAASSPPPKVAPLGHARKPSGSMKPLALVDKRTKESRRVSLGWAPRTGTQDGEVPGSGYQSKRSSMIVGQADKRRSMMLQDSKGLPSTVQEAKDEAEAAREARQLRRVSRLGYVTTNLEVRLQMDGANERPLSEVLGAIKSPRVEDSPSGFTPRLAFSPQVPQKAPTGQLDAMKSPRVGSSPSGFTPRLAFSPVVKTHWPPRQIDESDPSSSDEVPHTAPSSPWLDFDGSVIPAEARAHEQAGAEQARSAFAGPGSSHIRYRPSILHSDANDGASSSEQHHVKASTRFAPEAITRPVSSIHGEHHQYARKFHTIPKAGGVPLKGESLLPHFADHRPSAEKIQSAQASKTLFYAGFLGMPWLWLLGGWWVGEDGRLRVEGLPKVSLWSHEPSMREAEERDLGHSVPSSANQSPAIPASTSESGPSSMSHGQYLSSAGPSSLAHGQHLTSGSETSRTMHTAASHATLSSIYTSGASNMASSAKRIPRRTNESIGSVIGTRPEVAFFQSPVRTTPRPSHDPLQPSHGSFGGLHILIEDAREGARSPNDAASTVPDARADGDWTRSGGQMSVKHTPPSSIAAVRTQMAAARTATATLHQWRHLERFVLLNRIFAVGSGLIVMSCWSVALWYVAANF